MKKVLFIMSLAAMTLFVAGNLKAQEIGVRFGGMSGYGGAALDGTFGVGAGRIHADLGFFNNGFAAEALWDLLYQPLGNEPFNWYLGVGPSMAIWDTGTGSAFQLGASGEVGLEYHFNGAPLALGVDWRPTFWLLENTSFQAGGFGLNLRFVLNN